MGRLFVIFIMFLLHSSTAAYIVSNIFSNDLISNILSPIAALSSGIMVFITLTTKGFLKSAWFLIGAVGIIWGIADLIWMIMANIIGVDPDESVLLLYLYLLPNLAVLASALIYLQKNVKKWHSFQLVVDGTFSFILIIITLKFSLLMQFDLSAFSIHEIITTAGYIITDILTLTILMVLIMSARVNKISKTMKWIIMGYLMYIFTDFFYVFADVKGVYNPNVIIDSFYIISITFFGNAAYVEWKTPSLLIEPEKYTSPQNEGGNIRLLLFLTIPLTMFAMGELYYQALISGGFFVIMYYYMSRYIQNSIRIESMLATERYVNERLEDLVGMRTKDLKASYVKMERLAVTDTLSALYNRRYFIDKLDNLILNDNVFFSLYYLDFDHFKIINDIHGHEMGDAVLQIISERFIKWQSDTLIVARVGGDEFGIIQIHEPLSDKSVNYELSKQIMQLFEEKVVIEDYIFEVGVSIGISRYPYDAKDRDSLVKYADLAMYQAKKNPENNKVMFYSQNYGAVVERKNRIELLLKNIDYDKEFTLNYQPQFSISGDKLLGVEALLRWNSPELGYVPPMEFIEVAEDTGSIIKIGKWVIETAFRQIKQWNANSGVSLQMGINLSPLQFDSVDFFPFIISKLEEHALDPTWIDFEITENSAMNSGTIMEELFTALSGLGVNISVDDFGTGYSSLSYIKRFDIDRLKIAKELIDHIVENEDERLIIKAIILMSKGMGLSTIAEGVETKEQLDILSDLGCDAIQGYYFSKPLTKEVFEEKYLF